MDSNIIKLVMAFVLSCFISYILTPQVVKLAHKLGAIDVPTDERRVHKKPIPRLGGISIFVGFLVSSIFFVGINHKMTGILIGAFIIVGLGIIDDIKPLSAKVKFLGQIFAACIVMYFGIRVEWVTNPFDKVDGMLFLGIFSFPITLLWIVGATNTINLIDGLDGLAAGVSAISAITLTIVAYIAHVNMGASLNSSLLLIALAGGAVGFLPYNFNPAKIFMGDTGALFLGYILAVISIEGVIKSATALAVAIPILALGFPIFDTTFAIIRRAVNGKSIVEADKGHLHHRLLNKGLSQKQTVLALYSFSIILGFVAIIITECSFVQALLVLFAVAIAMYYMMIKLNLLSLVEDETKN